jgi:hypothetical protein
VAVLLAAMGVAAPAGGAPTPITQVNWDLMMNAGGFAQKLYGDCLDPSREAYIWGDFNAKSPFKYTRVFEGVGAPVTGSFDPATKSGTIAGTGAAIRFDNYNAHSHAIRVGAFGLRGGGSSATLTGRIERTRTHYSRFGPAKPLMRLTRLTLQSGPFQRKGKDVPDTFVIALQGKATLLPVLARELTRIRCHGPHIVTSHPIRAGASFGVVRAQLRPDAAVGIGGVFELDRVSASDDDGVVTVTPTAPAAAAGNVIRFGLPSDMRTPLRCEASYNCAPMAGTQFALPGGFVLSQGGRSTTVADLSVSYADDNGRLVPLLSGTLDGTPVTIFSQDFDDRVGSALGVTGLRSDVRAFGAHFMQTAAP